MSVSKIKQFDYKDVDRTSDKYFTYKYQYQLTKNAIKRYQRYLKATSKDVLLASANKGLRYNRFATPWKSGDLFRTAYAKVIANSDEEVSVELVWPVTNKPGRRLSRYKPFYYAYIQNTNTSFFHPLGGGPGFMEKAATRTRKFFMAELRKRLL